MPFSCCPRLPGANVDRDHQPWRDDAFCVDHALPRNIVIMKKVIGISRGGRKVLETDSNLSKMISVTPTLASRKKTHIDRGHCAEKDVDQHN